MFSIVTLSHPSYSRPVSQSSSYHQSPTPNPFDSWATTAVLLALAVSSFTSLQHLIPTQYAPNFMFFEMPSIQSLALLSSASKFWQLSIATLPRFLLLNRHLRHLLTASYCTSNLPSLPTTLSSVQSCPCARVHRRRSSGFNPYLSHQSPPRSTRASTTAPPSLSSLQPLRPTSQLALPQFRPTCHPSTWVMNKFHSLSLCLSTSTFNSHILPTLSNFRSSYPTAPTLPTSFYQHFSSQPPIFCKFWRFFPRPQTRRSTTRHYSSLITPSLLSTSRLVHQLNHLHVHPRVQLLLLLALIYHLQRVRLQQHLQRVLLNHLAPTSHHLFVLRLHNPLGLPNPRDLHKHRLRVFIFRNPHRFRLLTISFTLPSVLNSSLLPVLTSRRQLAKLQPFVHLSLTGIRQYILLRQLRHVHIAFLPRLSLQRPLPISTVHQLLLFSHPRTLNRVFHQ